MILCVPVTPTGDVDPRWGRAAPVAVAEVDDVNPVAVRPHVPVEHFDEGRGIHRFGRHGFGPASPR